MPKYGKLATKLTFSVFVKEGGKTKDATSRGISWREGEMADDFFVKRDSRQSRELQSATATITSVKGE